jgi:hypothetical protein
VIFDVIAIEILPSQFYGALIGVTITAIITVLLLRGQTANEEECEKSVKVFEKKQEIYHIFLERLQLIIQDGEITIGRAKGDGSIDRSVDELKDLIFQLGYLQLHSSTSTVNAVLAGIAEIVQLTNDYNASIISGHESAMSTYYASLSSSVSDIVSVLRNDLYKESTSKPFERSRMELVLAKWGLSSPSPSPDSKK